MPGVEPVNDTVKYMLDIDNDMKLDVSHNMTPETAQCGHCIYIKLLIWLPILTPSMIQWILPVVVVCCFNRSPDWEI